MKRNLFICSIILLFMAQASNAQFLNKLKRKAEAAVDKAIDKQVDNQVNGQPKQQQTNTQPAQNAQPAQTQTTNAQPQVSEKATPLEAYAKYDFIPGQTIIYNDNFATDAAGELPAGWNSNGNGAITRLNNFAGNWMRMDQNAVYLPGKDLGGTENFTLEFDLILDLKFNGYGFPEFDFGMIATGKKPVGDNVFLTDQSGLKHFVVQITPGHEKGSYLYLSSERVNTSYFRSPAKAYDALSKYYGQITHFALQAQKERIRLWVNGEKIFDAPKAIPLGDALNQLYFKISSSNYTNQQAGIYVSNIKVAQGAPDMRNKLVNEGRFSTSGILFDVNAATIKAESNGILQELASVLKDNPAIKLNIVGHTDADGNAATNQKLSLSRAESVKATLTRTYGIDAERFQVSGKGASVPLASNKTETGKAQNRRVEFIKL